MTDSSNLCQGSLNLISLLLIHLGMTGTMKRKESSLNKSESWRGSEESEAQDAALEKKRRSKK